LPSLRERKEDIPVLVGEFFERNKSKHGKPGLYLPPQLMPYFEDYRWPGNIRELENLVERIVLLSRSDKINLSNLPEPLRQRSLTEDVHARYQMSETRKAPVQTEGLSLDAVERETIVQALRKFDWNQTQAARYLDISRKTLMYRMAKHCIERELLENRQNLVRKAQVEETGSD
jgi:two-component system NtrC family response regulator